MISSAISTHEANAHLAVYLNDMMLAKRTSDLWQIIERFCKDVNLLSACCRCFPGEAAESTTIIFSKTENMSPDLEAAINSSPSYLDPFFNAAIRAARPIKWSNVPDWLAAKSPQLKYFVNEIDALGSGILVPVYGPLSRNGYFCFQIGGDHPINTIDLMVLHALAQTAYMRICDILYAPGTHPEVLSCRELQVLSLLAKGNSNKQIADELTLSVNSVNTYVNRLFSKLDVKDRVTAAMRARTLGYVT